MKLSCLVQKDVFPITNKLIFTNNELRQLVSTKMLQMKKKDLSDLHKDYVSRETERIIKLKEDLENQKQVIENYILKLDKKIKINIHYIKIIKI